MDNLSRRMAQPGKIEGSWGIEPVPERLHVLGGVDTGLLWGNLGASLLVVVADATIPSFLVSFAIAGVGAGLSRRSGAGATAA